MAVLFLVIGVRDLFAGFKNKSFPFWLAAPLKLGAVDCGVAQWNI